MLTLADLDAPGGVSRFARACADRSACMASLRYFAKNKNRKLRDVLVAMQEADPEGPDWPMWAWQNLRDADPLFRLHLLKMSVTDPGIAAHLDFHGDVTAEERAYLRTLWHSKWRADGQCVLPEWEKADPGVVR